MAMSNENKEQKSIENDVNVTVDKSKRKFSKAGLAAPVIMTLASKPVFAMQGLSNMISGNTSHAVLDNRTGGMSPGFWKKLVGRTDCYDDSADDAWDLTGFDYGTHIGGNHNWDNYTGGSNRTNTPAIPPSIMPNDTQSLREVLNLYNGDDYFHLIAGFLNAHYFQAKAGSAEDTLYFMSVPQFLDMLGKADSFFDQFGYSSLRHMVESNYHNVGTGICSVDNG